MEAYYTVTKLQREQYRKLHCLVVAKEYRSFSAKFILTLKTIRHGNYLLDFLEYCYYPKGCGYQHITKYDKQ